MTFDNLPEDWPTRSLSDTDLAADVVDLTLNTADRRRTSVGLLLCDDHDRLVQPMVINDVGDCSGEDRRKIFGLVCSAMGRSGATGLVVTLGRPHGTALTRSDQAWLATAHEVCAAQGVRLIGTFLADVAAVRAAA